MLICMFFNLFFFSGVSFNILLLLLFYFSLKNIETLSNLLRSVICLSPGDLLPCIYLCLNRLGPAYEGLELGIGETILMKAVAQATGMNIFQ